MQCAGINSKKKPCALKLFDGSKYCRFHKNQGNNNTLETKEVDSKEVKEDILSDKKLSDSVYPDIEFIIWSYLDLETVISSIEGEKLDKFIKIYSPEVPDPRTLILEDKFRTIKYFIPRVHKPLKKYADYACKNGKLEIVRYFSGLGTKYNINNLREACRYGHLDVIKFLYLNLKIPLDVECLYNATNEDRLIVIKFLICEGIEVTGFVLSNVCWHGGFETIKYLVDSGVIFNDTYMTILRSRGKTDAIDYILLRR